MRLIAVANQKGGCGKTTTAINLAGCLAFLDKRVLLVDLDPQGHASLGLGIAAEELDATLYDLLSPRVMSPPRIEEVVLKISPNLHLLPADLTLSALEQELSGFPGREGLLRSVLDTVTSTYDYIFLDCAPGLGILTFNALAAATEVLIPVEASLYSLHGLARFVETVKLAQEAFGKSYKIHALVTNYDARTRTARRFVEEIRDYLGPLAFKGVIRRNVRLVDAATEGRPIPDFDRRAHGFEDYMTCTAELIERGASNYTMPDEDWSADRTGAAESFEDDRVDTPDAVEEVQEVEEIENIEESEKPLPTAVETIDEAQPVYEDSDETSEELPVLAAEADAEVAFVLDEAMHAGPADDSERLESWGEDKSTLEESPDESGRDDMGEDEWVQPETPDGDSGQEESPDDESGDDELPADDSGGIPGFIAEILAHEGAALHTEEIRLEPPPPAEESDFSKQIAEIDTNNPPSDSDHPEVQIRLQGPVKLAEGTLFTITAPQDSVVEIAGEFNDWQPEPLVLSEGKGSVWRKVKRLRQGQYRYKFVVNGEWINDPHNANTKPNPFGGTDSVINTPGA